MHIFAPLSLCFIPTPFGNWCWFVEFPCFAVQQKIQQSDVMKTLLVLCFWYCVLLSNVLTYKLVHDEAALSAREPVDGSLNREAKRRDIKCAIYKWTCTVKKTTIEYTCCEGMECRCNPFWKSNCRCYELTYEDIGINPPSG
ncbi:uncharacterized protein LOC128250542 isoform X1 [Octopus bimaculoides]|uniref:uncharacterized protein LOC128250542 isoform X1 n=1 Tax=Octopus bimaculoides TaxID=37653 RepID=UPI0022E9748A|nr:uncharacterized protein LOC128250542 isoform X1 [Octopus bimaculoides]